MIAALFVAKGGCYFGLPDVDPWDEERDARLYTGPHPVVAHPPCQRWGSLAFANYARYRRDELRPGNDGFCFEAALRAVRHWGGVLEHPAKSRAWDAYQIHKPVPGRWTEGPTGWVCEVWQSAYGHRAQKATWLYCRSFSGRPRELDWSRPRTDFQIGFQDKRGKAKNKTTLSRAEANATPIPFRDLLISIAASSKVDQGT